MNTEEKNVLITYNDEHDFSGIMMDEGVYMQEIAEKMKSLTVFLQGTGKPSGYMAEQSLKDIMDR
ncbi:hypothetical protein [Bacillus licheniformis]|uniref:hypothetical protein n=1 Tax=Bacillus licheniformis TaxID=1402 RepID=UPI0011A5FF63|nr:hypothetical protein [Bacillus licheniformis]TWL14592.1 hypothetical protein CHCC16874_1635 [Bacillus licheniformis]